MANHKRSLNESIKAWRTFEDALKNLDSFEACAKWVIDNPQICKKLSGMGLMAVMKEDLSRKKD
jgi:predicted aldo/keto reductase-like oxidoreductase